MTRQDICQPCRLVSASADSHVLCQQGGEKMTEDAVEDMLDKVVKLLAYISDKDMFAEFYRKRLSRRLLNDKSASDDHERAVLTRLKQQCGAQFTSKVGAQSLLPQIVQP